MLDLNTAPDDDTLQPAPIPAPSHEEYQRGATKQLFPLKPLEQLPSPLSLPQWEDMNRQWGVQTSTSFFTTQAAKKSRRGPRSRSSQYRGVTFYRRTGRWESHIWDCGKQVYLGGFDTAYDAARAYDRAAIKFRGSEADINFNLGDYKEDMPQMAALSKEEFIRVLRRRSGGISHRSSKHMDVTLHKPGPREGRTVPSLGKKCIYLGILDKEVEVAGAYNKDVKVAVTSFNPKTYGKELSMSCSNDIRGMDACNLQPMSENLKGPKPNMPSLDLTTTQGPWLVPRLAQEAPHQTCSTRDGLRAASSGFSHQMTPATGFTYYNWFHKHLAACVPSSIACNPVSPQIQIDHASRPVQLCLSLALNSNKS